MNHQSVRRAVRELENLGYLVIEPGKWKGTPNSYEFAFPDLDGTGSQEGMPPDTLSNSKGYQIEPQRVSNQTPKGITPDTPYQVTNKTKTRVHARGVENDPLEKFADRRFFGGFANGLMPVPESNRDAVYAWASWLREHDLPDLHRYPLMTQAENGSTFYRFPYPKPPTKPEAIAEAIAFFKEILPDEITDETQQEENL